jgi:beta-lactamase superfamily II metal-dependent hydrolase
LVAPQLGVELQDKLVLKFKDRLKSEIFLIPQNGNFSAFNEKFVKIVSPEIAICQYGWTNQRIGFFPKTFVFSTQKKYTDLGVKFLRTDYVGAVIFNFVGKKYWYNTTVAEEEQRLYLSSDVGE